jgi:hypothetical protein
MEVLQITLAQMPLTTLVLVAAVVLVEVLELAAMAALAL